MTKSRIIFLIVTLVIALSVTGVILWQKPKLEKLAKKTIETITNDEDIPVKVRLEATRINLFPPQLEIINAQIEPRGDLKKTIQKANINLVAIQPSLIDLLIGKFWISSLDVSQGQVDIKINDLDSGKKTEPINLNELLKSIPISEINVQGLKVNVNYQNQYFLSTESFHLKAYNKKSSLILTLKEPNLNIKNKQNSEGLSLLLDSQLMLTKNTLSLSKLKIVKDSAFFLASGNAHFNNSLDQITILNINTRIKSSFTELDKWSNQIYDNNYLKDLKGDFKTDITVLKTKNQKQFTYNLDGNFQKFQFEKIILGDIDVQANMPDPKTILIPEIALNLSGNNKASIKNGKVELGDKTIFQADVNVDKAQLQTFLKDSQIANIPVWVQVTGSVACQGIYDKELLVNCPGKLTAENIKIQSGSENKTIVTAKKVDAEGSIQLTEKAIQYTASAKLEKSNGKSQGIISFKEGFDINYESEQLDLSEVSPLADLKFKGTAKVKGKTQGNSDTATFNMSVEAKEFEFEDYYFGSIRTQLGYRTSNLFLNQLNGDLESTRFNGRLNIDLSNELITGDIQLPFFRMEDIQQAILKKVDLGNKFLGSGSGRITIATPFESDRMTFNVDARLFKGTVFGEEYNEAQVQAVAKEGIINVTKAALQKEKSLFQMKGTIDTKLNSQLLFDITNGQLQLSTLLRQYNLPISGTFSATGKISGKLDNPGINTKAKVEDLLFNKKSYGPSIFSFNNLNNQMSLQFNIPEKLDLVVILPEKQQSSFFVDLEAKKLDVAPIVGFLVNNDSTRSYLIETTGEFSGRVDLNDFWNSEFSSTIEEINIDYKSNKISTTLPTNIELKNHQVYLNELSIKGPKQYIKITQPESGKYSSTFVISGQMNISFFKIFAPFIEKIDGFSSLRLELSLYKHDLKLIGNSYTSNSFLKFPGFPHAFEDLNADILFNQNKVLINSISGRFADGKLLGNGEIKFNGAKDYELYINTNVDDANIHFPKDVHTTGNANITLSGTGVPFRLAGEYRIKRGIIEMELDSSGSDSTSNLLEELLRKEVTAPMLLDIDIITENALEIKNSLIEGYVHSTLRVFDKIDAPRISGSAKLERNTIIRVRDSEFEVTDSNIQFLGRSPIDPNLFVRAETRMNSYDISLFYQRRDGKQQLNVSSQPPLPEQQIISMLALGQLPDQLEQDFTSQQQAAGSSFQIGTSLLSNNPLGRELKNRLGVDIQFSSSFDDQSNVAVPKVTITKRMSKKMQLSMSQTTGNVSQSEGRMAYELSDQWSTIFRVTNREQNTNNVGNITGTKQNNPFGVDLEYKVEFD